MSPSTSPDPRFLVLDPADNVGVALEDIRAGEALRQAPDALVTLEPILVAHKLAIRAIAPGEPVLKYGEVIGIASSAIAPGQHVHVHNVASGRLPGPER